jgi:hypothetical protein
MQDKLRQHRQAMKRPQRIMDDGPGFVRARECPKCMHTRCGLDCHCNCIAAVVEQERDTLRAELKQLQECNTALERVYRLSRMVLKGWDQGCLSEDTQYQLRDDWRAAIHAVQALPGVSAPITARKAGGA